MYVTQPITQTSPSNSPDSFVNIVQMFLLKSQLLKNLYILKYSMVLKPPAIYTFFKRTLMLPGWGGWAFAPWGFEHSQEGSWGEYVSLDVRHRPICYSYLGLEGSEATGRPGPV